VLKNIVEKVCIVNTFVLSRINELCLLLFTG
jgi:hypothetical protein